MIHIYPGSNDCFIVATSFIFCFKVLRGSEIERKTSLKGNFYLARARDSELGFSSSLKKLFILAPYSAAHLEAKTHAPRADASPSSVLVLFQKRKDDSLYFGASTNMESVESVLQPTDCLSL